MKVKMIPIAEIRPPESPARIAPANTYIDELASSIESVGLLSPLLVREKADRYEIVAGDRRYLACLKLEKETIPCVVIKATDDMASEIMLQENLSREDLSPVELAILFNTLQEKYKLTPKAMAAKTGKHERWIRRHLAILDYPDEIQEAIHCSSLPLDPAYYLARIENPETRKRYLKEVLEHGTSTENVKLWMESQVESPADVGGVEGQTEAKTRVEDPRASKGVCSGCGGAFPQVDLLPWFLCPGCRAEYSEIRRLEAEISRDEQEPVPGQ